MRKTTRKTVRRNVWRLDTDRRLTPEANGQAWRVVSADRDRADTSADYLFCPPDFLFPVLGIGRALRLEVDSQSPSPARVPSGPLLRRHGV